jgi:hypothetical protein
MSFPQKHSLRLHTAIFRGDELAVRTHPLPPGYPGTLEPSMSQTACAPPAKLLPNKLIQLFDSDGPGVGYVDPYFRDTPSICGRLAKRLTLRLRQAQEVSKRVRTARRRRRSESLRGFVCRNRDVKTDSQWLRIYSHQPAEMANRDIIVKGDNRAVDRQRELPRYFSSATGN